MNFYGEIRDYIVGHLKEAADIIDRYGLATDALIAPHPGHSGALIITDASGVTVSPLGALVLVSNPRPDPGAYELPHGWDIEPDGLWPIEYPIVTPFAQYLVTSGQATWGADPGSTIADWTRRPGRTRDEAVAALTAAAESVRYATGPQDPMWTGDPS